MSVDDWYAGQFSVREVMMFQKNFAAQKHHISRR